MELLFWGGIFAVSLAVLLKAADYFTESAELIGKFFGLPSFIIGVTIVAFGTSLPELVSSILAVTSGVPELVAGNVVGSNIANIFLIIGISALVGRTLHLGYEIMSVDLPILMASTFLLAASCWDGVFSLPEAILSFLSLALYLTYAVSTQEEQEEKKEEKKGKEEKKEKKKKFPQKDLFILLGSSLFVFLGAKYTIDSVVVISEMLKISTVIIGASVVALGTSLPELIVSMKAARKGKAGIAIGNVLGSNIFNALGVMSVARFFGPLEIPSDIISFGIPMMIIATFLYVFMVQDKKITRWEGGFLVIFYIFFIGKLFGWL